MEKEGNSALKWYKDNYYCPTHENFYHTQVIFFLLDCASSGVALSITQ